LPVPDHRSLLGFSLLGGCDRVDLNLLFAAQGAQAVTPFKVTYEIELEPGEKLELPTSMVENIGPGHWRISLERLPDQSPSSFRNHSAFLNSYAPEDEGLYDADPAR
jgi:hypothetical protein